MTGVLDNARKQTLAFTLNRFGSTQARDTVELLGKAFPVRVTAVSGQIVTVDFELSAPFALPSAVQMPISTSAYDWLPVQVGDLGLAIPSDTYLGGVSGLGDGMADLSQRANLSTLNFHPIAAKSWQPPGGDVDKRAVVGPNGAVIGDSGMTVSITLTKDNIIDIRVPAGQQVRVSSGGAVQPVKLADGSNSTALMAQ